MVGVYNYCLCDRLEAPGATHPYLDKNKHRDASIPSTALAPVMDQPPNDLETPPISNDIDDDPAITTPYLERTHGSSLSFQAPSATDISTRTPHTDSTAGHRTETLNVEDEDEGDSEDDDEPVFEASVAPRPPLVPVPTLASLERTTSEPLEAQLTQTQPPSPPAHTRRRRERHWRVGRVLAFFGYGHDNKARRALVSVIWHLALDLAQILAIIILLAYAAHHRSPRFPDMNEWSACDKPLGVWNALWAGRLTINVALTFWRWSFDRAGSQRAAAQDADAETANATRSANSGTGPRRLTRGPTPPRRRPNGSAAGTAYGHASTNGEGSEQTQKQPPQWYSRVVVARSIFTIVWFILAHVFEYTSTDTCRFSAPHIWWLTFALLCILYVGIVEVIVLALVVFIIGPIIFLFWNIFLLCIGRHPLQNPHYIKPDVGKLSKSVVDAIPLVIYIPPPPGSEETTADTKDPSRPITSPPIAYSYPPKPAPAPPPPARRRFRFLRLKRRRGTAGDEKGACGEGGKDEKNGTGNGNGGVWEDKWEKGEYPFVLLENNRAACAICLMDFEAPRRLDGEAEEHVQEVQEVEQAPVHVGGEGGGERAKGGLQLEDAGEGVQPLRLLECGHVFHKTCLDPWLIDVSGRCPVCQRPVEPPNEPEDKHQRRMRRRQERREMRAAALARRAERREASNV
ncbi:hypothetical protein EVG20_g7725 [Dentipellis fragilis]|uniref:RING-type domain-containing protein n=1 Tax=Dentipellis fragilis TaxID=205917 RepID=A0A4Y9YFD5_9AGAM|nr:hypothetical protein EVG20_g7725 [Dentipellis fragilis]